MHDSMVLRNIFAIEFYVCECAREEQFKYACHDTIAQYHICVCATIKYISVCKNGFVLSCQSDNTIDTG